MPGKERNKWADPTAEELRTPHSFVADNHLSNHVEEAVLPLQAYLGVEQVESVRAALRLSIQSDPVTRVLADGAVRSHISSVKPAPDLNAPRSPAGDPAIPRDRDIKK